VHRIVTAIRRDPTLARSQKAAAAAEEAAVAVEAATAPLSALEQAALDARRERGLAPRWERARAGMAIAARSADRDGNTQYYKTLFGNLSAAPKKRRHKAEGEPKSAAAEQQPTA